MKRPTFTADERSGGRPRLKELIEASENHRKNGDAPNSAAPQAAK